MGSALVSFLWEKERREVKVKRNGNTHEQSVIRLPDHATWRICGSHGPLF